MPDPETLAAFTRLFPPEGSLPGLPQSPDYNPEVDASIAQAGEQTAAPGFMQAPQEPQATATRPDVPVVLPEAPAAPKPLTPNQAAQQKAIQRNETLLDDPAGFAAGGGVVKSREELARMQGGNARTQEEAYVTEQKGLKEAAHQKAQKDFVLSGFIEQTAKDYQDKAEQIDRVAQQRISSRQKTVDELHKKHVDPGRAFHNLGVGSRLMWTLGLLSASQTKNSSANIGMLMQAADNMVNRDIAAQKADLANEYNALGEQEKLDAEAGKLDTKGLADWSVQRELRYKALDKMLDSKIAAMGNPAAERAGLLKAKAAINGVIIQDQAKFQEQIQQEAVQAKKDAHDYAMAGLNHQYKLLEQKDAADRESKKYDREQAEKAGERGIIAGAKSGIIAYTKDEKGNLQQHEGQNLRTRSVPDARNAQDKVANANKIHGLLLIMKDEMKGVSDKDIALQSYTPRFQAAEMELSELIAKINNDRITDRDVVNAANQLAGVTLNRDTATGNIIPELRIKGDTAAGVRGVLDRRLASLPGQVTDSLKQHFDTRDVADFDIQYKPTNMVVEPSKRKTTFNEDVANLGGGQNVTDIQRAEQRAPVTKEVADHLIGMKGEQATALDKAYVADKQKGALPELPAEEGSILSQARDGMANSTPQRIIALAQAAAKQLEAKGMSAEAKYELAMEARIAIKEADPKILQIVGSGITRKPHEDEGWKETDEGGMVLKSGKEYSLDNYLQDAEDFLKSDAFKAAREKAGMTRDIPRGQEPTYQDALIEAKAKYEKLSPTRPPVK